MTQKEISALLARQRAYYKSGATLPVKFRVEQLKKLRDCILAREADILAALKADLGKSRLESYMCEIGMTLSELGHMIKHVKRYAKLQTVRTPISQFRSHSYRQPTPYGNVLIMSPWNYPFLLTLDPLVTAMAAGNTAVVKPSAYSPATSKLIAELVGACFPEEYVAVVTGGREENRALLDEKFDFVFFTGSQAVGKEVLRHTAEHLTPAVLELGGKSPCIVEPSADLALSAKRIVFGKYLNCGQTCVAPDYVLCHASVKDAFLEEVKKQIPLQFGADPLANPDYGRIVNRKHFDRILSLIDREKLVMGGENDPEALRIAPTVMDGVTRDDAVMGEEIFGPILPILTYEDFDALIDDLKDRDKPLALYLFSRDKAHIRRVTEELSYGGGCINDVIIHLATSEMGFGGVGESGMGSYHGKVGFDTFSHTKSIVDKKLWIDLPMRYQPYTEKAEKTIRQAMH